MQWKPRKAEELAQGHTARKLASKATIPVTGENSLAVKEAVETARGLRRGCGFQGSGSDSPRPLQGGPDPLGGLDFTGGRSSTVRY